MRAGTSGRINCEITAFMRYAGQGWEIPVPLSDEPFGEDAVCKLNALFRENYKRFFGRAIDGLDGLEVEIVTWSAKATDEQPIAEKHQLTRGGRTVEPRTTRAVFDPATGSMQIHAIFERDTLAAGDHITGPAVIVERETSIYDESFQGGLAIYDVSDPRNPKKICFWKTAGTGVHRFDFDGRYAYVTPEVDGYHLNIAMILDLKNPAKPEEVGRWWMPGQWVAGGETPDEGYRTVWCHQILRRGNRLYVGYWHGGMVILDIEDMSKPKFLSRLVYGPTFPHPTHTVLPIPFELKGRRIALVATVWFGLLAPKETPPDLVARISADVVSALRDPKTAKLLEDGGYSAAGSSPEAFARFLDADVSDTARLMEKVGLKPR